jgi:hypothetical protein
VERRLSGGTVFSVIFPDADDERSTGALLWFR